MPAYVAVQIEIEDPETYARYRALAPASIARYGGRYLARGGATVVLEGTWSPSRFVLLEFPSMEQARTWWASPRSTPRRRRCAGRAHTEMLLVEGIAPGDV